jgi:hypothetical protein
VKLCRATQSNKTGLPDAASVIVLIRDSNDLSDSHDQDDYESLSGNDEKPKKKALAKKQKHKSKSGKGLRIRKIRHNPATCPDKPGSNKPRAIIDPGTELDIIGGVGWSVISMMEDQSALLDSRRNGWVHITAG